VEEDDEHAAVHARSLMAAMPFSVIGSEKDVKTGDGHVVKGRQYAWGVAEVENEDHCDFKKLRSILIRTHMLDLIHTTEESHYEAYRALQMETRKFGEARPRKLDNPKFKEEEENLRKRFTEQVKVEEQRFRHWEQKLISERDRLNKDLESTHAAYVTSPIHPDNYPKLIIPTESSSSSKSSSRCKDLLCEAMAVVKIYFLLVVFIRTGGRRSGTSSFFAPAIQSYRDRFSKRPFLTDKSWNAFLVPVWIGFLFCCSLSTSAWFFRSLIITTPFVFSIAYSIQL
jgi:hypothetical protein